MKNSTFNLITRGSLAVNKYLHNFFDDELVPNAQTPVSQVLPVEPLSQRKLFIKLALQDQREVFMQLNPLTAEGQIVNFRGHLRKLANGRFLLQNHGLSYIFSIEQVRYIAG